MNRRQNTVLLLLCAAAMTVTIGGSLGQGTSPPAPLSKEQAKQLAELAAKLNQHADAGDFGEVVRLRRQALALREKWQGKEHWETVNARFDVEHLQRLADLPADTQRKLTAAVQLRRQGLGLHATHQYAAAEGALRKSLEVCREVVGDKHPATAAAANLLAFKLDAQGKYAAAQPLHQQALVICREMLGEKHPETARSYNNVAANLHGQGKYAAAQPLFQKALDVRRAVLGEKHPNTATSYNNLAANLGAQGKHAAAQPLYQQALALRRELLGDKHPDTAQSYNNLAGSFNAQGKYSAAQPLHQQALDIWREVLGDKHPDTARGYYNVASNLKAQGKYAAAQPLYQKVLDIFREVLGEKHPNTASSYNGVASNLQAQGKYAAAQPLFQKALDLRREVLGEKHPDTALSYNGLAVNLHAQGQYAKAQPLLQQSLDVRRAVLGEKHPDTAQSYNNLAGNLADQGKYAAAQPLYQQTLDIWREMLGEKHPDTARSYNNLAGNLIRQGKYAAAQPLYQQALHICREVLGEKHPDTAASYFNVAADLHHLGEYGRAEKVLRLAVLAHDIARVDRATSGFERALETTRISPRPRLAALLARRGEAHQAWQQAEADLARGLLDDLPGPADIPADPKANLAVLHKLDAQLVPLLTAAKLDADQVKERDGLLRQRGDLLDCLSERAVKKTAERVLPLEKIQPHIAADAALFFWIDADPDYWACVLRRDGQPRWQKLVGSGEKGAWTADEWKLQFQLYDALERPDRAAEGERLRLASAFAKQRFEPLRRHLKADGKLPAVRKLLVVPTGALARVPLDVLTGDYTISYVPSGSVFARLAEQHRPLQASPLLALGDPVFSLPAVKPAAPPDAGLFVQLVLPNSNAVRAGLQAGDVLLRYNDMPLKTFADLKIVKGGAPVKVHFWRDGKENVARLQPGKLGVALDKRPAAEAVAAWRAAQVLTASLRSTGHQPLPATRFEVQALSGLVGAKQTTLLLGSHASEQALDGFGKGGLKRFRVLHFATHGDVDLIDPYRSALILAQDRLPDALAAFRKGEKVYDGRLTVETILRAWDLDADLVVLSACQTALGKSAEGEGLLGFAQALLRKGARSVLLSRWKVDDTATALLMLRFYENALGKRKDVKAPLGRAAALDEARQWLRSLSRPDAERLAVGLTGGVLRGTERDDLLVKGQATLPAGERPFAHPFYWASFVLVGDPN